MELRGDRVMLRPLAERDVDRIVELGADQEVERWWRGLTPEHVRAKARGTDEGVAVFAIVVDGEVAGMIQFQEELDEEYRHAGIDLFLGAPYQGLGLGTDAVRTMARHLIHDRAYHRLTIDPAAHNERRSSSKPSRRTPSLAPSKWLARTARQVTVCYLERATEPSSPSVQCGLWATSQGWPSGSTNTPE